MRLLFLCNSDTWGSAERYSVALARGLASRGHACFLAAPVGSPAFSAAAAADDVTELPFDLGPGLSRRSALDLGLRWRGYRRFAHDFLANVVSAFDVDVMHAQFKKEQLLATPAAAGLGLPVVWSEHDRLPRFFRLTPLAMQGYRGAAECVAGILCASEFVRLDLAAHGLTGAGVRVCRIGLDAGEPPGQFERSRVRTRLGLDAAHFVVGCNARLAWPMGQRNLLHAVAALRPRIPEVRLVLVGDGPDRDSLRLLAHQLDLARHVLFLGERDDARALLPAFDVFAAPSLDDGPECAVLEAMAAERPVIATRVGSIPEALADGAAGILIDPDRSEPLIAGLERLFHEPRLRLELGSAGRKRVICRFSVDAMLDSAEAAFIAAYGRAGSSAPAKAAIDVAS